MDEMLKSFAEQMPATAVSVSLLLFVLRHLFKMQQKNEARSEHRETVLLNRCSVEREEDRERFDRQYDDVVMRMRELENRQYAGVEEMTRVCRDLVATIDRVGSGTHPIPKREDHG